MGGEETMNRTTNGNSSLRGVVRNRISHLEQDVAALADLQVQLLRAEMSELMRDCVAPISVLAVVAGAFVLASLPLLLLSLAYCLVEFAGPKANNIVLSGPWGVQGVSVFMDPSAPPEERYKAVYMAETPVSVMLGGLIDTILDPAGSLTLGFHEHNLMPSPGALHVDRVRIVPSPATGVVLGLAIGAFPARNLRNRNRPRSSNE